MSHNLVMLPVTDSLVTEDINGNIRILAPD